MDLTTEEFALKHQSLRVETIHKRLQRDLERLQERLRSLEQGEEFKVPPELAGQVAEWARTSRHLRHKTEDYKERVEILQVSSLPFSSGEGKEMALT